jgi:hypothetical protein
MTLREKQSLFAIMMAKLIVYAYTQGYEVTFGDAYRDPRLHGVMGVRKSYSHPRSTHKLRLALDLNLFRDGAYLDDTEDHRPLGEWWEKQHELCRWGGRFGDGNHYSFAHEFNGEPIA